MFHYFCKLDNNILLISVESTLFEWFLGIEINGYIMYVRMPLEQMLELNYVSLRLVDNRSISDKSFVSQNCIN